MILYKKPVIDFLPRYLWWTIGNFYFLFLLLILFLSLCTLLILYGIISGLSFLLWFVIGMCAYLYVNRKARTFRIALRDQSLVITCSKYFSVFDVVIPVEKLRIELYKDRYYHGSYSAIGSEYYLYFTSATDKTVWVEISDTFYTLGRIVDTLSRESKIQMGDYELNFLAKYRRHHEGA